MNDDYEPDRIFWATPKEQTADRRTEPDPEGDQRRKFAKFKARCARLGIELDADGGPIVREGDGAVYLEDGSPVKPDPVEALPLTALPESRQ